MRYRESARSRIRGSLCLWTGLFLLAAGTVGLSDRPRSDQHATPAAASASVTPKPQTPYKSPGKGPTDKIDEQRLPPRIPWAPRDRRHPRLEDTAGSKGLTGRQRHTLEDFYLDGKLSDDPRENQALYDWAVRLAYNQVSKLSSAERSKLTLLRDVVTGLRPPTALKTALARTVLANLPPAKKRPEVLPDWLRKSHADHPETWRIVGSDMENIRSGYLQGIGSAEYVQTVYKKDLPAWRRAASLNWPGGHLLLGRCYSEGMGVAKDLARGLALYRKAADGGLGMGHLMVAHCYLVGEAVRKDRTEAVKWWRSGAKAGCAHALLLLGFHFRKHVTPPNHAEANKWFGLAAEGGYAKANYELGRSYDYGLGVEENGVKAVQFYRKAAAQGLARALNNLGICYARGGKGVVKSYLRSEALYRRAVKLGSVAAMENLGGRYEWHARYSTIKTFPFMEGAIALYRMGADKGDARCMNKLGQCLMKSPKLKDNEEGLVWIRKAIRLGHSRWNTNLEAHERTVAEKKAKRNSR